MALGRGKATDLQPDNAKSAKGRAAKLLAHVLLAEDDPVLSLALEEAFLRAGARDVVICATMQASKEALEKGPRPDAIVLDVHLADRNDGWAIAELVTFLGPKPPRIAFSTGSPGSIPDKIASLGMVFEKPYDPDELVRHMMKGERKGIISRLLG